MVRIVRFAGVALLALLVHANAWAQGGGTITGRIADETGGVLPGVTVDLHSGATELTETTDGTGTYRIENVPAGPATVTFKLINFTIVRRDLMVMAGQTITANAILGLSLTADVVVTGSRTFRNIADLEAPAENLVGIASAASQGAITAKQLEARPLMRPAEYSSPSPASS